VLYRYSVKLRCILKKEKRERREEVRGKEIKKEEE
jgi:hypothetical protein